MRSYVFKILLSTFLLAAILVGFNLTCHSTLAQSGTDSGLTSCGDRTSVDSSTRARCGDSISVDSPDTERALVEVAVRDELLTWEAATATCAGLGPEWRLSTRRELALLIEGQDPRAPAAALDAAWYWSSSPVEGLIAYWIRQVGTGQEGVGSVGNRFAVRCVRSEIGSPLTNDRF
jgi:hypothetical protein